jgi:hypothetical protein
MIPMYEYIRIELDMGDLHDLNSMASTGWHVTGIVTTNRRFKYWALLERQIPEYKKRTVAFRSWLWLKSIINLKRGVN